jgi:hypothetical protein
MVLDRYWRLAVGLTVAASNRRPPVNDVDSLLAKPDQAGLLIVETEIASVRFRLAPVKRSDKTLKGTATVLATLAPICGVTGYTAKDAVEAFRGDGTPCPYVDNTRLNEEPRREVHERLGRLPDSSSVTGTFPADTGASVHFTMPPDGWAWRATGLG